MPPPPYLQRIFLRPDAELDASAFPGCLPFVRGLDLEFDAAVTFLVGENGSGKSTLLEVIAEFCGLPVGGGGRNELADGRTPHAQSELAPVLGARFRRRPTGGYFFRAEFQAHFATLLEERNADRDFRGGAYAAYGGRSLHTRSHGEAFFEVFTSWLGASAGIVLMDEPEAALSPQRQLALLARMAPLVRGGQVQFVIATHSPILLTLPGASLLSFDGPSVEPIRLEDSSHYQITRGILECPERYWRHLAGDPEAPS